jgi:hypothetical protein
MPSSFPELERTVLEVSTYAMIDHRVSRGFKQGSQKGNLHFDAWGKKKKKTRDSHYFLNGL